eukprot:1821026-Rhodomonas_salina.3
MAVGRSPAASSGPCRMPGRWSRQQGQEAVPHAMSVPGMASGVRRTIELGAVPQNGSRWRKTKKVPALEPIKAWVS